MPGLCLSLPTAGVESAPLRAKGTPKMKVFHDAGRSNEPRLPPHEWLERPETKILLAWLQVELPAGSIAISDGKPGQPKEVFAHHKIALAYAEYLGPDFYAVFHEYYLKTFNKP